MDQLSIHGWVDGQQSQVDFRIISIIKNLDHISSLMIFTSYANILVIINAVCKIKRRVKDSNSIILAP